MQSVDVKMQCLDHIAFKLILEIKRPFILGQTTHFSANIMPTPPYSLSSTSQRDF